ncbi:hypothetical protein RQP46_010903 [Phenoliferia psychrophenolica]
MSLIEARDLLTFFDRSTRSSTTLDSIQHAKLDATIKQIRVLLDDNPDSSSASYRDLSRRLAAAESLLVQHPLLDPSSSASSSDYSDEADLDDVLYLPSIPSPPTPSLISPILSPSVPLPSPPSLSSLPPGSRTFPPPIRARPPPPPPPPKSTSTATSPLSPKLSGLDPLVPVPLAPATNTVRSRTRASRTLTNTQSPSSDPLLPPTTSSSTLLEHHASLQSSLLGSLTSMSSQLKENSKVFADSLEKDKEVVESAQGKLDGNLTRMKKEGGRLGGYGKKSGGMVWITIGLVGAVAAIWVGMFLLIKVT